MQHPSEIEAEQILALHVEDITISRRRIETAVVSVATRTRIREHVVSEPVVRQRVEVDHVPAGRFVDAMPQVRQDGDVTIVPVVEERLVPRLYLKEEVHIRLVRDVEQRAETVQLREQQAVITRTPTDPRVRTASTPHPESATMIEDSLVAVYETAADADATVQELKSVGVPDTAVSRQSAAGEFASAGSAPPVREEGFWSRLLGGEPDHDANVYDRSIDTGAHVVTVKVSEQQLDQVTAVLERHHPIDIDERAAEYGHATQTAANQPAVTKPTNLRDTGSTQAREGEQVVPLSEEQLTVGKRLVNSGTTRIRRFVTTVPVEENVTLHSEKVSIERRPVTGTTQAANADFADKTIEVTESEEEAVIGKTARVREEVVIRKDGSDRVETVRDSVRREDIEISKDNATQTLADRTAPQRAAGTIPPTER